MKKTGIIYKVISPSKRMYIGQTITTLHVRKNKHINSAFNKNSLSYNLKFSRAIRKYNGNLKWIVLEDNISIIDLDKIEKLFIKKYNSIENGYNSTTGGQNGYQHSTQTKKKIGEASVLAWKNGVYKTKANEKIVKEIREMYVSKQYSVKDISDIYISLAYNTVLDIVKNKTWKDKGYKYIKRNKPTMNKTKAKEVRRKYNSGKFTLKELSSKYKLCVSAIQNIVSNKSWHDDKCKVKKSSKIASLNVISSSKLLEEDIIIIRDLYRKGKRQLWIAKKFNISVSSISNIVNRKTWRNI